MYAIVKTGGKQYKVTKGLIFETELLDAEVNSTVELEVVLAADDNGNVVAGNDAANAKVSATVVEQEDQHLHLQSKEKHPQTSRSQTTLHEVED